MASPHSPAPDNPASSTALLPLRFFRSPPHLPSRRVTSARWFTSPTEAIIASDAFIFQRRPEKQRTSIKRMTFFHPFAPSLPSKGFLTLSSLPDNQMFFGNPM